MTDKNSAENLTEPVEAKSYINYLIDADGIVWMEAGWDADDIDSFAQLLYELHSGQLMGESMEFIKDQCQTPGQKKQYHAILTRLNELFFTELGEEERAFTQSDKPVVPPTQVFPQYGGETSPF